MELKLPIELAEGFKSKSQIARITTEAWVIDNISCPNCGDALQGYPANEKSKDVHCRSCETDFQIKSSKKRFSKKITGAEYSTTVNSVRKGSNPSLMLLFYDETTMTVIDFQVIHHSFITEKNIIPRKPLSAEAKRAGWQGCLIDIEEVPKAARIFMVRDGVASTTMDVRHQWASTNRPSLLSMERRGWLSDVLSVIDKLPDSFNLADVYTFEGDLKVLHPKNNNIQAKIREQLQFIRDMGLLEFVNRGEYRKTGFFNGWQ